MTRYAVASAGVLVALALLVPPFIYSDQADQLKALQQSLSGESRGLNELVFPDSTNLAADTTEWIVWWPPSTQVLAWPLLRAGLSIGAAIRIIAIVAVVAGAIGWAWWWALFELPTSWILAAALLVPWQRYASNGLFQYSAETLAFAAVPWVLIAAAASVREIDAGRTPSWSVLFSTGLASGALYWVKYSSVFVTAGVTLFVLARLATARSWKSAGALAIGAALPAVLLSVLNRHFGGAANMLAQSGAFRLDPRMFAYAIGNPAAMSADAGAVLDYVLTNPERGLGLTAFAVALASVPAGVTLAWLLTGSATRVERLAATTLAVTVGLIVIAWMASPAVSFEARHVAGAAMAVLPAAVAIGRRGWRGFAAPLQSWLVAVSLAYVIAPWIYGPVSVAVKTLRPQGYVTSDSGIYNPILSAHDARRAAASVRDRCRSAGSDAVWYVPDPLTALEFHGRMVMTGADFEPLDVLRSRRYEGRLPVCALLTPKFEGNGKGPAIRASFVDVRSWTREPADQSLYDVWIGRP
jgi:hypothetical protein